MSIVRVGLAETKGFDEGYEAIFGKKQAGTKKAEAKKTEAADKSKKAKTIWQHNWQQFPKLAASGFPKAAQA